MKNEHVLRGLVRKRAEIAGQIEHTQMELRKLVTDLDAIDAAIRIFDSDADTGAIPNRQYPPRHAAFRGEMMRHVMGALRLAEGPVTSRDIARTVMTARGLNPDDPTMLQMIRKRVGACLWKLKQGEHAREAPLEGELKGWVRA
ncbi:hypothetical protein G3T14_11830 [Methylobacterium sp. BTF04]|uniref:hypothetical protein n=1 Tax=Methylobacterium sp. BTF04 TaxID=2708300 RepID=UPI0013D5E570|nr:hypothetical protein [Methylobacterium sp. BTF04]NEU12821.1 hypothetical protein [Methylobacterium sp. BTF04]